MFSPGKGLHKTRQLFQDDTDFNFQPKIIPLYSMAFGDVNDILFFTRKYFCKLKKIYSYLELAVMVANRSLTFAVGGCHVLLLPEATTFMMSQRDFSQPEVDTGPAI